MTRCTSDNRRLNRKAEFVLGRNEIDFRLSALGKSITLLEQIVALKISRSSELKSHAAELTELPSGAVVKVCGKGFNDRTLTVHWNQGDYLVFVRDLGLA